MPGVYTAVSRFTAQEYDQVEKVPARDGNFMWQRNGLIRVVKSRKTTAGNNREVTNAASVLDADDRDARNVGHRRAKHVDGDAEKQRQSQFMTMKNPGLATGVWFFRL